MAESQMLRLLTERRRRLVASIMGYAERELFDQLSTKQQQDFRRKTLTSIDEFCDLIRDVIKISTQDAAVNDHALELLESLHDGQRALAKRLS